MNRPARLATARCMPHNAARLHTTSGRLSPHDPCHRALHTARGEQQRPEPHAWSFPS